MPDYRHVRKFMEGHKRRGNRRLVENEDHDYDVQDLVDALENMNTGESHIRNTYYAWKDNDMKGIMYSAMEHDGEFESNWESVEYFLIEILNQVKWHKEKLRKYLKYVRSNP